MGSKDDSNRSDEHGATASVGRARVLVAGIGGLGSPAAWALAAGGIGCLVLVDPDAVESSNLHRQILHRTASIGMPKVESARRYLAARWPGVRVEAIRDTVREDNVTALLDGVDFAIDGTDDVQAKYAINDGAVRAGVAYSHAGVVGLMGQTFTILPGRTACLRCVFPQPPSRNIVARCSDDGVLGPVVGAIGFLQAAEALRYVRGQALACAGRLLTFDARAPRWRAVSLDRYAACSTCRVHAPLAPTDDAAAISHGS